MSSSAHEEGAQRDGGGGLFTNRTIPCDFAKKTLYDKIPACFESLGLFYFISSVSRLRGESVCAYVCML